MPLDKKKSKFKRLGTTTILIWSILIGTLLAIRISDHNHELINEATNEARDYFRLNLFYRAWTSKMGGVYVSADKVTPNPYLQIPNRDITTSDNRKLTLVNPAYMTRMVFEEIIAASPDPIINKITSLKPLNPVNAPDEWERQSLAAFDRKEYSERSEITEMSGKPYLRFISAFTTSEACLKCHAQQGYKVGDVRGAIVISVPLSKRFELHSQTNRKIIGTYGLLWLIGSIGIAFASNRRFLDEEALHQEHTRAQTYLETVETMIVTLDADGRITAVNRKACQVLGYREDELLGASWFVTCLPQPDGMETIYPHFQKIMAGEFGPAEYHENPVVTKSGEIRHIAWHNSLLRNTVGQVAGTISAGDDITERKQIEDIKSFLAQTSGASSDEPFFNALARFLGQKLDVDFVCIDRLEGDGLTASTLSVWHDGRFEDNVSYALKDTPCGDAVGKEVCSFPSGVCQLFPNDKTLQDLKAESYVGVTLWSLTGQPIGLIALIARKPLENSGIIETTLKMVALRAAGEIQRLIADEMLRESKEKYRLLVENLASGIVVHALDSSVVFANSTALSLLGLSKEQIKGKAVIDPDWRFLRENGSIMPLDEYPVSQVLSSGKPLSNFVVGVRRPDFFDPVWVLCHAYPVMGIEGQLQQIVVTFSDITNLKRAEAALKKRLVALTRPLENAVVSFDELFDLEDVQLLQDEFAKATGVASIITFPDGTPLTAPSNFTRLCNDIIRKTEKGCANCFKSDAVLGYFNPEGPTIQPCLSGGLWDAGAGISVGGHHIANWLIGQVRDQTQTEEKMADYAREIGADVGAFMEAFHEVPSMSRLQFEQVAQSLFTLAKQLSLMAYQNIQQARFINERKQSEEKLLSLTQRLQLATSSAQLGIWDWNVKENTMVWDDRMFDLYGITRESFPNSIDAWMNGLHPEDKEEAIAECQAALKGEKEFDSEFRVLHPNGTVKHIRGKGLVLRGANGTAERMLGINYDITDALHAEEEKHKLESQLQQAQKMESVGRLAGGVAHDFNNMLSVIMGHAELGLMHLEPNHPVCADLKEIGKTAERSADLTRQLLAFARRQTVLPKVIDLNDTITNMLKMLQRLIGEDIHLIWQPSPDQCRINMDPSQVDQILANLCVNARDAIENTGRITIETGICSIDADYCAANPEASPGDYVRLVVSDDGKGMDRETLSHVFEPFYTTKELGKGTGLGLATIYGAVKQNNGFINIYSEPGKGTSFSIYLPHYVGDTSRKQTEEIAPPVPRGQETILLVEDEVSILNITAIMLEKQGYTVLRADSPGRAMELAREYHGAIDLLMTDVIMPEMNGRDLAGNLLAIHPGLKRLFMSGYTADVIALHGVLDEGVYFIQKPFSLFDMAAKVREVLEGN